MNGPGKSGESFNAAPNRLYRWLRHRGWLVIGSRKVYVRIPGGEVQWGRVSRTLTVWFRGRRLV